MTRPIALFTGQWADLPLRRVCELASEWGYDGLEIAASGDHFDVVRAVEDDAYVRQQRSLLEAHGLQPVALSNHLVGQATCDGPIDDRHRRMLPAGVWGDGRPDGVRERASHEMIVTAAAAARLGVTTVTGFTGSPHWHAVAMFPPISQDEIERGYREFADRWSPILDAFEAHGVRFALEVHPGEVAYDYWTTSRTLEAVGQRTSFGLNFDPSHLVWQDIDLVGFLWEFRDRIYHVHVKDTRRTLNGRNGRLASHLGWGDPRRGWDFVSPGHGDVPWESCVRVLNAIDYRGPLCVEWEDAGMDRIRGAQDAIAFVRRLCEIEPAPAAFDLAFRQEPEPS